MITDKEIARRERWVREPVSLSMRLVSHHKFWGRYKSFSADEHTVSVNRQDETGFPTGGRVIEAAVVPAYLGRE